MLFARSTSILPAFSLMSCFQRTRRATPESRMSTSSTSVSIRRMRRSWHVRAHEIAVPGPLEAYVFQAEFEPGDLAGLDVPDQPGVRVAPVVALPHHRAPAVDPVGVLGRSEEH